MFPQPSVNQIASTYAGNPAPLARKVDQDKKQNGGIPQDLRQLLALNDITQGRNAAGIQQALNTQTNMPTVAQNLQQLAQQAIQSRMMDQAREQQRLQQKPPTLPEGTPQPKDQPQGIDALRTNVGEEYAEGGIIGRTKHFDGKTDGSMVVDPMLGTMIDTTPPKDDLTFLERIGVLNPENRRANEKLERDLRLREQKDSAKESGGRPRDPRASQFNIPDIETQVKEEALASAAAQAAKEQSAAKPRVNAPESTGIVAALPAAAQTEAYKKLTDLMNQDPEAKAKALRDRYLKEVGSRDLSIYDKTAAELEARKQKLNAPKAGYDAMMEYLENIAASGGRTSFEAGARGASRQRQQQMAREEQQNLLMDKILELGAKKSEAQFAEKKGMFDMTQKERDDIFTKAFDAAKSVNASDDKAKELAAQAVQKELDRKAQIRAAAIGAQDRDNLMSRAKALMAVDKTLSLEKAMEKAATIAATGQLGAAETRANTAADQTRAKIREKYAWVDMLPPNDPTGIAMRRERDKALAAVGGGAGLPDAVTSAPTGKPKFLGYE